MEIKLIDIPAEARQIVFAILCGYIDSTKTKEVGWKKTVKKYSVLCGSEVIEVDCWRTSVAWIAKIRI